MTDPNRIADESPTATEARLLRSASLDVAPPHGKLGVLAALGLGSTGVTAAAAATTVAAASARGATPIAMVAKWVALGAVAGTVATGAAETARFYIADSGTRRETPARTNPETRSTLPKASPRARFSEAVEGAQATSSDVAAKSEPVEPEETRAHGVAKRPTEAQNVKPPNGDPTRALEEPPLSAELKSIDGARRALSAHDPGTALDLLAEHDRTFAVPRLAPEATVLRVEALLALGKKSDAIRTAKSFLANDSASAYRDHVRSLLREAESP
jgi:hypothetical protein